MLWAYYDDSKSQMLWEDVINTIKRRVAQLGGSLQPNENLVKKILMMVSGDGGDLVITPLDSDDYEEDSAVVAMFKGKDKLK